VSTKPAGDSDNARTRFSRQIDEAFEEASRLAGSSLPPTDFYQQFLNRTLTAIDAPAGVVWLRTPQGFLQMACQVNLDKVGLDTKRGGRQCHNEILRQVFQSAPARPAMVEPQGRLTGVTAEPGTVPAANLTDFYALFAPIVNQDKQPFGLLEIFSDPALDPRLYQTFLQYTVQMAGYASQYHQFSNARQTAGLERVFTQVEAFAKLIHSSLNPTEVAYHIANEGRRIIECDRLCVGVRHGKGVTVEAVSGADVVEKASTHVRRMRNLFNAVIKFGDKLVYKGHKDEGLPPDLSHALDEYLAESQPKLLIVTPIRDDREKDDTKPARSILLLESFNPPEQVEPMIQRLDLIGKHAAGALYNAAEMKRIPFGMLWRPLGRIQEGLGGKARFYWSLGILAVVALAVAMVFVPYQLRMEAKGEFLPHDTKFVYASHPGSVQAILVKPGDSVPYKTTLIRLFDPEIKKKQGELENARETASQLHSNYEAIIARGGLPTDRELELRRESVRQKVIADGARNQLDSLKATHNLTGGAGDFTVVAPSFETSIPRLRDEWRVISGDNRNDILGRTVQQNQPLMRLGSVTGPWRVEMKIPQQNIGHIARALNTPGKHNVDKAGKKYLNVDVLLTSSPDESFPGRLYDEDMAREAIPNTDDRSESAPVVLAYVRVNLDEFGPAGQIPEHLKVAGQEVHTKIHCGREPMGYALFHGVWEWFYENVVFFF
jgi:hypothetical protein